MEGRWRGGRGEVEGRWRGGGGEVEGRWRGGGGEVEGRASITHTYMFSLLLPFLHLHAPHLTP